ncbi:hepatitis A virus cellular receptor 2 isoform X1 [Fukomys damarensis]|uniref:hepatitis A virus cellular receptor 2 isoform X1 n=1 Tax=Fukomys damarensis TaxID=885580 RepID=UPI001455BCD9|nr:hepatitis A virus cellular receptor 2 isoform X1 [Fukomys damarensis]
MFSHLSFECVLLLLLLLLTGSLEAEYIVELGQNAQLPCTFHLASSGNLVPVCWGKGSCPTFDCPNVLLRTKGRRVTYRTSERYQVQSNFYEGDVSLTIKNVILGDGGTYCCRVQHPGPMNDGKFNLQLVIRPSKATPAPTARRDWTSTLPRMLTTNGHGSETQTLRMRHDKNETQTFPLANEVQDSGTAASIGVYIVAGVSAGVALGLILGALIVMWYSHRKQKFRNTSLITLANLPPSGLANAGAEGIRSEVNVYTTEENVYTIEENFYTTEENVYTMEENVYEIEDPTGLWCGRISQGQGSTLRDCGPVLLCHGEISLKNSIHVESWSSAVLFPSSFFLVEDGRGLQEFVPSVLISVPR